MPLQAMSGLLIEHGETARARQLRHNRLRVALAVAAVEGILVLAGAIPWWVVPLAAGAAFAAYLAVRHRGSAELVQLAWIGVFSQLGLVLLPVAAALLAAAAALAIVGFAIVALVVVTRDHR